MRNSRRLLALIVLVLTAGTASADIYMCVDDAGHSYFSDVREDIRCEVYMKAAIFSRPQAAQPAASVDRAVAVDVGPAPMPKRYLAMIKKVAHEQKVDPALLHAVVAVESGFNPKAKSPKGATGLMQLMPDTAKRYGVKNLLNPADNVRAGARYLRDLLAMFSDDVELAVAAYNAGEGAVIKAGHAIPNYPETRAYVPRVLQFYEKYRARIS